MSHSPSRVREAGDSALLLESDAVISPDVNARILAIATIVRESGIPGVRAVVPTHQVRRQPPQPCPLRQQALHIV